MKVKGLFKGNLQNGTEVIVQKEKYVNNGNVCLQTYCLIDDDVFEMYLVPYATLTINLNHLKSNEIAIDVNNFPEGLSFLLENKYIDKPHRYSSSGFCTYPVAQITDLFFSMETQEFEMNESKALVE